MREEDFALVARGWESQNEEFDYDLEVEGEIPKELVGTFYRNGPGRMEVYDTKLAHPIDGDGMITAISFKDGKAHFKSKYVKTSGYEIEEREKRAVMKGMMGTVPVNKTWGEWFDEFKKDVTRGRFPNLRFKNPSNTSVYHWGGKLMSVWEGGMPYSLDPRTLETVGRENLGGSLEAAKSLSAHGRYDKEKDVLVTFGLQPNIVAKSKLFIFEYDRNWKVVAEKVVELESYWYCHDIMITANYYLVHHSPFSSLDTWTVAQVTSGMKAPGQLMHYYPKIPCRIIVIPRAPDSTEHVRHLDIDPCHVYHHLNAFEENGHIKFSSVTIGKKFNMEFEKKMWLSNFSTEPGRVHDFDIDLSNGKVSCVQSDPCACEFPTHHPDVDGKKWRYAYLMASEEGYDLLPFSDVIKFDREQTGRQRWSSREESGVIGEPVFVPREGGTEEDDGWVLVQVYHYKEHKTQIVVLDAKDLAKGPIARLKLAHHTPFTFHGTFSPEIF
eukprot:TRINITY_DN15026_c0_g1_i1.p1 TRINITY_DN15026_c0_g1~~TRINITY_DN15026_c0_g1_i1.p1  ORF type:complete len:515 (+),score=183.34 TRINITY_DN15026_c0_g1_i1:58-1545(+)